MVVIGFKEAAGVIEVSEVAVVVVVVVGFQKWW